jgi:hypothetical protein
VPKPPFDWSIVTKAAQAWMGDHDTAPKYLLLPIGTNLGIMDLAADIYDIDTRIAAVEAPAFTDELLPTISAKAILDGPIFQHELPAIDHSPSASEQLRQDTLIRMAKDGKLTNKDIQLMSMEDYALVRSLLLAQVDQALRGKTAYQKFKDITSS